MATSKQTYEIAINTRSTLTEIEQIIKKMNVMETTISKLVKVTGELQSSFEKLGTAISGTKDKIKETNDKTKDPKPAEALKDQWAGWTNIKKEVGVALERVAKYTILYKAVRFFTDTIVEQTQEIIKLRDSFVNLQRIAGITDDQVEKLTRTSIQLARAYGALPAEVAEITKIWVQQGRTGAELNSLIEKTLLATKSLGIGAVEASEGLTVLNKIFGASPEVLDIYISKLKNVESNNAIVAKDLVDAYRRVGGAADAVGVDIDTLNGLVTGLAQTLRVTGGYAGNFLKVLFARIQRPDTLKYLEQTGIINKDNQEIFSDTSALLQLLASRWGDLNSVQQKQIGTLLGGVRRFSDVITLFKNYDDVLKATTDSVFSFNSAQNTVQKDLKKFESSVKSAKASVQGILVSLGAFDTITGFATTLRAVSSGLDVLGVDASRAIGGLTALSGAIGGVTVAVKFLKGTLFTSNPLVFFASSAIAVASSMNLVGKAFENSNTEISKSDKSIASLSKRYKELTRSTENYANALANKIITSTEKINDEGIDDEIVKILKELGIEGKISGDELEILTQRVIDYKDASLSAKGAMKDGLIKDLKEFTNIASLAKKTFKELTEGVDEGKLNSFGILLDTISRETSDLGTVEGSETLQFLNSTLGEYINTVEELDRLSAKRKNRGSLGLSIEESEKELNRISELQRKAREGYEKIPKALIENGKDWKAGYENLRVANNLIKATAKSSADNSKNAPISVQWSQRISETEKSIKSYLEQASKLITINDKVSGTYSDMSDELDKLAQDDSFAKIIAEGVFGTEAVEKDAKNLIAFVKENARNIIEGFSQEIEQSSIDKRIKDLLSFDVGQIESVSFQIDAENQLIALRDQNAKISEREIKIKKIQLDFQNRILKIQEQLNDPDLNAVAREEAEKWLAGSENLNKSLEELLEKARKLTEQEQKRAKISQSKSFFDGIIAKTEELDLQNRILDSEFNGQNINEQKLKAQLEINQALRDGTINVEEYNKNMAFISKYYEAISKHQEKIKRNALSAEFSSSFVSAFGDIPNKLQQDRESAKQIAGQLQQSADSYASAIERYREAEINFEKTGSETFRQDMESAREEATKFKEEYNQAVEASKEITSQTAKLRDIFNEIGDIIKKKIFEQIADQLINQTGAVQSITNQVGTLLGYIDGTVNRIDTKTTGKVDKDGTGEIEKGLEKLDKNNENDTKNGVERGMGAVIPKLVNAFATSQIFRTQSGQTGSMIGSALGSLGFLGGLSPIGGLIGGLAGDLFGSKRKVYNEVPDLSIENAPPIERLTEAVLENTNQLETLNNRTIGAPADFTLPRLSNLTSTGSTNVNINVSGYIGNDQQLADLIAQKVNQSLRVQTLRT